MNLIKFTHRKDWGHDWYVQILSVKGWSLLQVSVSWTEFPGWPYIQIKSGTGSTLSIMFWAYKFGFDIDLLSRTWKWNYLENLDEQQE